MKKKGIAAMCFACFAAAEIACAAPATSGSTGAIDTPSADVLRTQQFSFGYYHLKNENRFVVGTNLAKNLEFSAVGVDPDGPDGRTVRANLKYALHQEGVLVPGIALGVEDIADKERRSAYITASKALPFGFRVHAGLGTGNYDKGFAALEKKLVPFAVGGVFPDMSLIAEYNGRHANYGLRASVIPGMKVDAGWRGGEPYVGFTYTLY